MKKVILLSLAFIAGLFLFSEPVSAGGYWQTEERELCRCELYQSFVFARGNGCWIEETGGNAVIYDYDVDTHSGTAFCRGSVSTIYQLPQNVVAASRAGSEIKVYLERPQNPTNLTLSYFDYCIDYGQLHLDFCLSPKIAPGWTLSDFADVRAKVPLIDCSFGKNIYTQKPLIGAAKRREGWFSESSPYYVNEPYFHPLNIKNPAQFAEGQNVELCFYCPVVLRFTETVSVFVETADPPEEQENEKDSTEAPNTDPKPLEDPSGPQDSPPAKPDGPASPTDPPVDPNPDQPAAPEEPAEEPKKKIFRLRLHRVR